jgi:hypothetical protein
MHEKIGKETLPIFLAYMQPLSLYLENRDNSDKHSMTL